VHSSSAPPFHSLLTDVGNDVRGVENANALFATAAVSSSSDVSSRQKKPCNKRRRLGNSGFVKHEAGVSRGVAAVAGKVAVNSETQ
jgi:hypothetical protein